MRNVKYIFQMFCAAKNVELIKCGKRYRPRVKRIGFRLTDTLYVDAVEKFNLKVLT